MALVGLGASLWASGNAGVHREQAGLGAEAYEHKGEGQVHQRWVEQVGVLMQDGPEDSLTRICQNAGRVGVNQHGAVQPKRHANGTDNDVLKAASSEALPVKPHQKGRTQGRCLNGDPHHNDIVGRHRQQHGEQKQVKEAVIAAQRGNADLAVFDFMSHIANRVKPCQQPYYADNADKQRAKAVYINPLVQRQQCAGGHFGINDQHR